MWSSGSRLPARQIRSNPSTSRPPSRPEKRQSSRMPNSSRPCSLSVCRFKTWKRRCWRKLSANQAGMSPKPAGSSKSPATLSATAWLNTTSSSQCSKRPERIMYFPNNLTAFSAQIRSSPRRPPRPDHPGARSPHTESLSNTLATRLSACLSHVHE